MCRLYSTSGSKFRRLNSSTPIRAVLPPPLKDSLLMFDDAEPAVKRQTSPVSCSGQLQSYENSTARVYFCYLRLWASTGHLWQISVRSHCILVSTCYLRSLGTSISPLKMMLSVAESSSVTSQHSRTSSGTSALFGSHGSHHCNCETLSVGFHLHIASLIRWRCKPSF